MNDEGYVVILEKSADKALAKLTSKKRERIMRIIDKYPFNGNIVPLQARTDCFRIRLGDLRIVYRVDKTIPAVFIEDIGLRGDIYK